jgi:hypothetical protein
MDKVILGIHGLANKPDKATLAAWWQKAILEGLQKNLQIPPTEFQFEMVYWADLLYKHHLHSDECFTFDKLYNNEPYVEAKEGALHKHEISIMDRVRAGMFDVVGDTADFLKVRFGVDSFADFLIGRLLKDLDFYYDEKRQIVDRNSSQGLAKTILRQELLDCLVPLKGKSIMLIAHSMGSIIAYDALRDLGRRDAGFQVSHLVTIGSPLGLPHVKAKIIKERTYDHSVRTPSVVSQSWLNLADRKDPVAADIQLKGDYLGNAAKVEVRDDIVSNDYVGPAESKPNHHKSYGYLRTPEISEHIAAFLSG